ncbi:RelA/SpoT domain protein [Ruegeria sp. TrichCH4B]|nr:RelA/SpoT domain protein [Ruegeria sp. TrichCH4B]
MKRVYADQLVQVQSYLGVSNRRSLFEELQKAVVVEIRRATENPKFSAMLSDVFCRADKDPKNPIKSDKKIAIKLYKWSRSAPESSKPKPQDVHDIAGVTIVCNYPSDTDEVSRFLEETAQFRDFHIEKMRFVDPSSARGYRAYHAIATGKNRYRGLNCEIQIKTLLTMSWGAKTHDLTYKPNGHIDPRLTIYMDKLTNVAQILDEQSEILKSLIQSANERDEERKTAARTQLLLGASKSTDSFIIDTLERLQADSPRLAVADFDDEALCEILESIDSYIAQHGLSKEICRLIALFSINRSFLDFNDWAIEKIDELIATIDEADRKAVISALAFRSAVCMSLGEYEESIATARSVCDLTQEIGESPAEINAKANLAYYLSEAFFHRAFDEASGAGEIIRDATDACAAEALQIIDSLKKDHFPEGEIEHRVMDTLGAVLIVCSHDESGVRDGLRFCHEAKSLANGEAWETAASAFFSLHEKRAFRRLLSFK